MGLRSLQVYQYLRYMKQSKYYVSKAANPIELAELNITFYKTFIKEMGCCGLYRDLWPGEDLYLFIERIRNYPAKGDDMRRRKISALSQYEKFYEQLTGYSLK